MKSHLGRFKELLLLKTTLWKLKLLPKLKQLPKHPKLASYLLSAATYTGFFFLLLGIYQLHSEYGEKGEQAFEQGKRVVISLPYGEVAAAKKSAPEAAADETAESAETPAEEPLETAEAETPEQAPPVVPGDYEIEDVRPKIVVVLSGLGLSRTTTEGVFTLPAEVTLSFSPYANAVDEWSSRAKELGYEVMMDLPLEPNDYPTNDAGPYALLSESEDAANLTQLSEVLDLPKQPLFGGVAAVDEKFTFTEAKILPVLQELKKRKLLLLYNNRPRNYFLPQLAKQKDFPIIAYDLVIDAELSEEAIRAVFAKAKEEATKKGFAILLGRPYPITVERLHAWLKTFRDEGLVLVPLSRIAGPQK